MAKFPIHAALLSAALALPAAGLSTSVQAAPAGSTHLAQSGLKGQIGGQINCALHPDAAECDGNDRQRRRNNDGRKLGLEASPPADSNNQQKDRDGRQRSEDGERQHKRKPDAARPERQQPAERPAETAPQSEADSKPAPQPEAESKVQEEPRKAKPASKPAEPKAAAPDDTQRAHDRQPQSKPQSTRPTRDANGRQGDTRNRDTRDHRRRDDNARDHRRRGDDARERRRGDDDARDHRRRGDDARDRRRGDDDAKDRRRRDDDARERRRGNDDARDHRRRDDDARDRQRNGERGHRRDRDGHRRGRDGALEFSIPIPGVDSRVIIRRNGNTIVRSNDEDRFGNRRAHRTVEQLPRGAKRITVDRPNGSKVVTVRARDGSIIRRVRHTRNGRKIVLIDNERFGRRGERRHRQRDYRAPRIDIPQDRYIVEGGRGQRQAIEEALKAPPVEPVDGGYTLQEIRSHEGLRARMRRVDLTVTFAFDSAAIPENQFDDLEALGKAVADEVERDPSQVFLIEGHTDAPGSDNYNLRLSDARAESVAIALSEYFDIPPENLVTQGYGEEFLKIDTPARERRNRRVTVRRITPLLTGDAR